MSRTRTGLWSLSALAAISLLAGCRQDMQDQPKFVPQRGTDFFADGRSARPQVLHTVARGQLPVARQLASRAKGRFPIGSPGWVKADDIASVKPPPKPRLF